MAMIASQFLTYSHTGPVVGSMLGPSMDGTRWLVVSNQRVDDRVRVGVYAIDTPEAAEEADKFLEGLIE